MAYPESPSTDVGRELMTDRRTFIQGAVALALVSTVPLPPLDDWDLFLYHVRERLIRLVSDGYEIKNLEISPEYQGQRLVQVWLSRQYSIVKSVVWWQRISAHEN